jgi:hypothetical protein
MEVPRFSTGMYPRVLGEVGQRPRFAADDCRQIVKNLVRFPSAARRLAIAAPMPREPPVMSAIFPSSFLELVVMVIVSIGYI